MQEAQGKNVMINMATGSSCEAVAQVEAMLFPMAYAQPYPDIRPDLANQVATPEGLAALLREKRLTYGDFFRNLPRDLADQVATPKGLLALTRERGVTRTLVAMEMVMPGMVLEGGLAPRRRSPLARL